MYSLSGYSLSLYQKKNRIFLLQLFPQINSETIEGDEALKYFKGVKGVQLPKIPRDTGHFTASAN